MKKLLTLFALALLPFISFAQDAPVFENFGKGIKDLPSSFRLNDHVNVIQVNVDGDNCNIIAVDEGMNVLWNTPIKGYGLVVGNFKGKVLAIAATEYSMLKGGANNIYEAYLLDPKTGKPLLEKTIYKGESNNLEYPKFIFNEDGSSFTLAVRESDLERKLHIGLPGIFGLVTIWSLDSQYSKTNKLTVIRLNEKLDAELNFKPQLSEDILAGVTANNRGDVFVVWISKTGAVNAIKYTNGQQAGQLQDNLNGRSNGQFSTPGANVNLCTSSTSGDILYLGAFYKSGDGDRQLGLLKFDFGAKQSAFINEIYTSKHVNEIEKSWKKMKDIDKPELGGRQDMGVRYMNESAGKLIVAISSESVSKGMNGYWFTQNSVLLNVYDQNLGLRFQQTFPMQNTATINLQVGYRLNNNMLYLIGNHKTGMATIKGLYGQLNLQTGNWDSLILLSKKHLDNSDVTSGGNTMWYSNGFIVPYLSSKMMSAKVDVNLQQNGY